MSAAAPLALALDNDGPFTNVLTPRPLKFPQSAVTNFREPDTAGMPVGTADGSATASSTATGGRQWAPRSLRDLLIGGNTELPNHSTCAANLHLQVEQVSGLGHVDHLRNKGRTRL